ncbi:ATP/GTP-binding protein [Streptomyces sp. NPDC045470]|uniref:ATP/GTP-binding protein n=1 Tax=Streptomyces sp. NPDC045470 TaxID=3155469 RepID=UPI0033CA9A26
MLMRRLGLAVCGVLTVLALPGPARADGPTGSAGGCKNVFVCVEADAPGSPGGASSGTPAQDSKGGGKSGNGGKSGGSASRWSCTYKLADPPPPADSLDWAGHKPGDGVVYEQRCIFDGNDAFGVNRMVWAADPPEGGGAPAVDPAVLAQQAVDKMLLRGAQIGITPKPGGKGVVGMPVYLWTATGPETYGPNTASASAGGITVTATAKVSKIVWQMGDGTTVTCTTPGTPYRPEFGKRPSPDCGHRYRVPSVTTPSGRFHVTATSTWAIDWQVTGGGQSGQLTEVRDSAVDITVAEVQVLN